LKSETLETEDGSRGWEQLDTARLGLSLIVAVAHAHYVFITPLYKMASPTMMWAARYAVFCFFILSGLVIGRSFSRRRDTFLPFMIRRLARIYPPLMLSILLVVALDQALHWAEIPTRALANAGPMINSFSYDLHSIALNLATFGFRGWLSSEANPALWSLVLEMRCYMIVGLVAQSVFAKTPGGRAIGIGALFYILSLIALDVRLDGLFMLCYAAFAFGFLLSRVVTRIPRMVPAVAVDISYSLYVFHQPIMLAICFAFYQPSFPTLSGALFLCCAAFSVALGLSLLSAQFVEPFRGQALAESCKRICLTGFALQPAAKSNLLGSSAGERSSLS
jgi:peptidoglycan/LPS O-acetylase OafA/YrhL